MAATSPAPHKTNTINTASRRARIRALVLTAAKQRTQQALTLHDGDSSAPLFAPFSPSPLRMVHTIWDVLDAHHTHQHTLTRDDLIVDLGCGDARWLIAGAQRYSCKALGIELDAALVAAAKCAIIQSSLCDSIDIVQSDILQVDISHASLVIVYAFAEALSGIRKHLETQLGATARVLSIGFRVPDWTPTLSDRVDGLRWYFYELSTCRNAVA